MAELPSIAVRVEKLRFLAEELQLAFEISNWAPDAWEGRTMARHVLLRAADVIEHARRLRQPLREFGSTTTFHTLKETYATWFEEYFATARHRLTAHLQDLDFGARLELWNDIEVSKVDVFVDGAREIYEHLTKFNLPGYVPWQPPPELSEGAFREALASFREAAPGLRGIEVASDPLATTRPNTSALINSHPLHERAGQLNLISRWVRLQRRELQRFEAYPRIVRILRARTLTDIVSYADCLVTRPVAGSAPQAMKGLDEILRENGEGSQVLGSLPATYRLEEALQRLRLPRNTFAAHLDTDDTRTLATLVAEFDATDWPWAESVFETLESVFRSACREVFLLRTHLIDGETLAGVIPARENMTHPYDPAAPAPPTLSLPTAPLDLSLDDYPAAIDAWLGGAPDERREAATVLRNGMWLEAGEPFTVELHVGAGKQLRIERFTAAHVAVLERMHGADGPELGNLLQLLALEGSGYPARAAEVVLRFAEARRGVAREAMPQLCSLLGELADWDAPRHAAFLRRQASPQRPWLTRRAAKLGLFKALVRAEGIRRINQKVNLLDGPREVGSLLADLAPMQELDVSLAMASAFCEPLSIYRTAFAPEYAALLARIQALAEADLRRQGQEARVHLVATLLACDDFVGVVLLMAEGELDAINRALLAAVREGWIAPARHDQSARHLFRCLWRAEAREDALRVAEDLAERNPLNLDDQMARLEVMTELGRDFPRVRIEVDRLTSGFVLSPEQTVRAASLQDELASRPA